jgi:hypothetical protein
MAIKIELLLPRIKDICRVFGVVVRCKGSELNFSFERGIRLVNNSALEELADNDEYSEITRVINRICNDLNPKFLRNGNGY